MKEKIILLLLVLAIVFGLMLAIDKSLDNKYTMLCNSAKVSRNEEYLEKCGCFYKGDSIRCIHNVVK